MRESDLPPETSGGARHGLFVSAQGDVLFDDPLKVINSDDRERTDKMGRELRAFLQEAQSELLMVSPYLVPGKAGVQWSEDAGPRRHGENNYQLPGLH